MQDFCWGVGGGHEECNSLFIKFAISARHVSITKIFLKVLFIIEEEGGGGGGGGQCRHQALHFYFVRVGPGSKFQ